MDGFVKVGVIGPSGYTGRELLRILANHPYAQVVEVYGHESAGVYLNQLYPFLPEKVGNLKVEDFNKESLSADVYFLCVPHGKAIDYAALLLENGKKVVDLSADFRLKDEELYEKYYQFKHPYLSLLKEAVYGMPEFRKKEIEKARLVANPGCLARASLLGLHPFVEEGVIDYEKMVVIDVKTGVSGAGRKPRQDLHFPEMNEDFRPYSPVRHRHLPEILQEALSSGAANSFLPFFVPHLIPADRGILASIYFKLKEKAALNDLKEIARNKYAESPFVKILEDDLPSIKRVRGSNFVEINLSLSESSEVVVFVALDNLVSGASGTAVHNMNIMFGIKEESGLTSLLPL